MATHTLTGLRRWSCEYQELPPVNSIKSLHVYDFDNTLFQSPLPNHALWESSTVGLLQRQDGFINGGWWHDPRMLKATGEGEEKEAAKAWSGWWNEDIARLVTLSAEQEDAVAVLLTGRSEAGFSELIKRMIHSKGLKFDLICLKPRVGPTNQQFSSTMEFKKAILTDLMMTYREADDIKIYEDRPNHTKAFTEWLARFNSDLEQSHTGLIRKTIKADVVQVYEGASTLDPITETAEVQRMINDHNAAVTKLSKQGSTQLSRLQMSSKTFFTGYLFSPSTSAQLLKLVHIPPGVSSRDMRYVATSVLISWDSHNSAIDRAGGIGKRVQWRVTGTAIHENKIWAARVEPADSNTQIYTASSTPHIVLAAKKFAKNSDARNIRSWTPVPLDQSLIIDSTVGQKVVLRVEPEGVPNPTSFSKNTSKRRYDERSTDQSHQQTNSHHNGNYNNGNRALPQPKQAKLNHDNNSSFERRDRGGPHHHNYHHSNNNHHHQNRNANTGSGNRGGGNRNTGGRNGGNGRNNNRGNGGGGGGGGGGQGGRGRARGGGGGGPGGGGGGGGGHNYRSLDDVAEPRNYQGPPPFYADAGFSNSGGGTGSGGGGGGLPYGPF